MGLFVSDSLQAKMKLDHELDLLRVSQNSYANGNKNAAYNISMLEKNVQMRQVEYQEALARDMVKNLK